MNLQFFSDRDKVLELLSAGTIQPPTPEEQRLAPPLAALFVRRSENTLDAAWYGQLRLDHVTLSSGKPGAWEELGSWSGKEVDTVPSGEFRYLGFRIVDIEQRLVSLRFRYFGLRIPEIGQRLVNLKIFFDQGVQFSAVLSL